MSSEQAVLCRSLEQLLHRGTVAGLDERALLERFRAHRDGQALAVLVAAHGPMVLGVCRRILREPQDIDDAFQSTFLVLVRRAGDIGDAGRLGAWLHGVARCVALRLRSQSRGRVSGGDGRIEDAMDRGPSVADQAEHAELRRLIDEELGRLPARYRDVIVLCDLEGRTYTEAAALLRCPLGTVQSRLARGRERLRGGLVRRGVGAAMGAPLLIEEARAAVPESLLRTTLGKAAASSAGGVVVGTILRTVVMGIMVGTTLAASIGTLAFGNRQSDKPAALATEARQEQELELAGQPERDRTILLEVRDAQDNKPLPGAAVWYQASGGSSRVADVGRTDAAGHYTITLAGDSITQLTVVVASGGHVPKELHWGTEDVPENPVVGLERGVRIGGKVVDEQGEPIAGVRVLPRKYVKTGEDVAAAVTDAQGRWESDALKATEAAEGKFVLLPFRLTHPDHVAAIREISIEQARARTRCRR